MQKLTGKLLKKFKPPFYVTVLSPSTIGTNTQFKIEQGEVYCVKHLRSSGMHKEIVLEVQNTKDGKVVTTAVHRFRLSYKNEEKLCKR